jgi:hypothetical protein
MAQRMQNGGGCCAGFGALGAIFGIIVVVGIVLLLTIIF